MSKFGENYLEGDVENVENISENNIESPGLVDEKVSEKSQEAIVDGDNLLRDVSESMELQEVEGGQGLLEAAKGKLAGVGERIQDLALATRQRIKEAITGKDVKGMTDEELANHLRKKREEHAEAHQHNKAVRSGEKFDLGGIRAMHSFHQEKKVKKERAQAAREVKKRGMEVLTPEDERFKKMKDIRNEYFELMREKEGGRINKERREEIDLILAGLEDQASKIDYKIPSDITKKYTPEEIEQQKVRDREERRAMNERISQEEAKRREEYPHWTKVEAMRKKEAEEREKLRHELESQQRTREEREIKNHPNYGGGSSGSTANSFVDDKGNPIRL